MKTNDPFYSTRSHWGAALLVAAAAVALLFDVQAAKPPGGSTSQPCITFDDQSGDSVQSDGGGKYCNAPKKKVLVSFTNDGHLVVDHEPGSSRGFLVDFGSPITVTKDNGSTYEFQSTVDLIADGILYDFNMTVGGSQSDFDMLTMALGDQRLDVNLTILLALKFPDQNLEEPIFIKLAPEILGNGRQCEISDPVKVTCTGVDAAGKSNAWHVETQDPNNAACVSQDPFGTALSNREAYEERTAPISTAPPAIGEIQACRP